MPLAKPEHEYFPARQAGHPDARRFEPGTGTTPDGVYAHDFREEAGILDGAITGHAMGCWTTGVAVITTVDRNGRPHGMTVNSLTSVSLDPPLLLACLTHGARTAGAVLDPGRFADRGEDHFAGLPPTTATTSSPPCPAHPPTSTAPRPALDAGDHVIVSGAVLRTCYRDGTVACTVPPQVSYELTDLGRDLLPQVISLARWTATNTSRIVAARANYDNRSPEGLKASATRSSATRLVEPVR